MPTLAHGATGRIVTGRQDMDDPKPRPDWVQKAWNAVRRRPEMKWWAEAEELAWHRADALRRKITDTSDTSDRGNG